jgi:hypothetical protein
MAKKKKPKPFRVVTAVKAAAREHLGTPPPTRREDVPVHRRREKHKPTLGKLLSDAE